MSRIVIFYRRFYIIRSQRILSRVRQRILAMNPKMNQKVAVITTVALLLLIQASNGANTYRGAVVEYNPSLIQDENARVAENMENYKAFMKEAKSKGADIITFPEYGLWIRSIYSPIPEPADRISPCDSPKFNTTQIVKNLSCAAKTYAIYTVVNLLEKRMCKSDDKNCPPKGYYGFNTNVVFDRNGTVVARYSKFNLYDEPVAEKPREADISFFDTDFGVRFGVFTCFDIHFPVPGLKLVQQYQITDFVSPFYWFSELPFLTALQVHRGWAETNNVNLLVSGLNYPLTGTFGSGIFNGKNGNLVQTMPEKITRKLLIADIPKIKRSSNEEGIRNFSSVSTLTTMASTGMETGSETNYDNVNLMRDQMQLFNSEFIKPGQLFQKTVCSNENFCCSFRMIYEGLRPDAKNYTFRAVVLNGVRKFGFSFKAGLQVCGVVVCEGLDIMGCTNRMKNIPGMFKVRDIQIKGDFKAKNSFQIPSTLTEGDELQPMSVTGYKFTKTEKDKNVVVSLELNSAMTNLQTFAIWGRDFTKDA